MPAAFRLSVNPMAWEVTTFLLAEYGRQDISTHPLFSVIDGDAGPGLQAQEYRPSQGPAPHARRLGNPDIPSVRDAGRIARGTAAAATGAPQPSGVPRLNELCGGGLLERSVT